MAVDISGLNAEQLRDLSRRIEKQIVTVEKEALRGALKEMRLVAEKLGVAFEDVIALHVAKAKRAEKKVTPKYANPDNPSQTWGGRGRRPAWVTAALEAGKSIDDLAI